MTIKAIHRLSHLMDRAEFDILALNPGPTLFYLTGLNFHLSERPIILFYRPPDSIVLVLPQFECLKAKSSTLPIQCITYYEDPTTWIKSLKAAFHELDAKNQKVGVEPARLRYLEIELIKTAVPRVELVSAEDILADLRMQKDEHELAAMRQAVKIAQTALMATLDQKIIGSSEREIAHELTIQLLHAGSDVELPFSPIVASGPNSANPHATPSDRRIKKGDLLLIDWGASHRGYCSDLTRTFSIAVDDQELLKIARIVEQANHAGRSACAPGVSPDTIDQAARNVIEKAGYGDHFTHRTGHGLGLEAHEPPYIRQGAQQPLLPGTTFTIEPGIYLPGRGGVRIEDDIVITEEGAEYLSDLPRQLVNILN